MRINMPQPVTVFRWDDPGAPQIVEQRPSEIISILKKCLIEGYGAKAPLGWSVLFEDAAATKIIFQNSIAAGGSGGVLRVFTGNSGNGVLANTFFTPAQAATDIDNLFRPGYRHKMMISGESWKRWVVIGTATAFYVIIGTSGRVAQYDTCRDCIGFFGDFNSLIPNDSGRFIALTKAIGSGDAPLSQEWIGWNTHFSYIWYSSSAAFWKNEGNLLLYAADGRNSSKPYNCMNIWGTRYDGVPFTRKQGVYTPLHISLRSDLVGDTYTGSVDEVGVRIGESVINPIWRGYLPGALHEVFGRYSAQDWPITEELNGNSHFLLRSVTAVANVWINMVEW
jgi:hypothetical protein